MSWRVWAHIIFAFWVREHFWVFMGKLHLKERRIETVLSLVCKLRVFEHICAINFWVRVVLEWIQLESDPHVLVKAPKSFYEFLSKFGYSSRSQSNVVRWRNSGILSLSPIYSPSCPFHFVSFFLLILSQSITSFCLSLPFSSFLLLFIYLSFIHFLFPFYLLLSWLMLLLLIF